MTLATIRRTLPVALVLIAGGCAGGGANRLSTVSPEAIPELEARRQSEPANAVLQAQLGVAYFRATRLDEARAALDSSLAAEPGNGIATVYLGMTAEAQGDFPAARAAYERYATAGRSRELQRTARSRLALLARRQIEFEARQALVAEAARSQGEPEPNTIAVMPFSYSGSNEDIRPLTRGFAQLVITDLAKSRQVRVLERERMQAMLDEMRLSDEGRAAPETAVRSGRLLAAARVVQGTLSDVGEILRADAAVVDSRTSGVAPGASAQDRLSRLFDLQKEFVYEIFRSLGIQLSDAERAEIDRRPTQNLAAFLAYSRGLEAEDRGDYSAAAQLFNQAARIDPGFLAARAGAAQSNDMQAASSQTVADVDVAVSREESVERGERPDTDTMRDAIVGALTSVTPPSNAVDDQLRSRGTEPPAQREPTVEGTGTEGVKPPTGRILIIITRP
jgi:TolB-like protein